MGIFNEQSFDHPFAKGIQGAPGVGFRLTSDGNFDITGKKLTNVGAPTANNHAATKKYVDDNTSSHSSSTLTVNSDIDMKDRFRILNLKSPSDSDEPATKQYSDSKFLPLDGSKKMTGILDMQNKKIVNIAPATGDKDAVTIAYLNANVIYRDGTNSMTGTLKMGNQLISDLNSNPINAQDATSKHYCDTKFYARDGSVALTGDLNIAGNRIKNLRNPSENSEASTKKYVDDTVRNYLRKDGTVSMTGDLNMGNKKITGLFAPTSSTDGATKKYVDDKVSASSPDLSDYLEKDGTVVMTGSLKMGNNKITGLATPTANTDAATKKYVDDKPSGGSGDFKKDGSVAMTGNLNMGNKRIFALSDPVSSTDATNMSWVKNQIQHFDILASPVFEVTAAPASTTIYLQYQRNRFVFTTSRPGQPLVSWKPSSGTYVNKIVFNFNRSVGVKKVSFVARDSRISDVDFWVSGIHTGLYTLNIHRKFTYEMSGVFMDYTSDANSKNAPISTNIYLGKPSAETKTFSKIKFSSPTTFTSTVTAKPPTDTNQVATKDYVDKAVAGPAHYKNVFDYIMKSASQWTDEITTRTSFTIDRFGNLSPNSGNFHSYNHKVAFLKLKKYSGGYKFKIGLNFYRLAAADYTICLEFLNPDYRLWHKTQIEVDHQSSSGLTFHTESVKKLTHTYYYPAGSIKYMYYHRVIVSLTKSNSGRSFFHITLNMPEVGGDMTSYPSDFTTFYAIVYGINGAVGNIDPDRSYDYHTAFDIQPSQVSYNVGIDMNNKAIINLAENNSSSSAATFGMIKELRDFNNLDYTKSFTNNWDFSRFDKYVFISSQGSSSSSTVSFNKLNSLTSSNAAITFPTKTLSNLVKKALNISNFTLDIPLPNYTTNFNMIFVFQFWPNRDFSIIRYDTQSNAKLFEITFQTRGNRMTIKSGRQTSYHNAPSRGLGGKVIVLQVTQTSNSALRVKINNESPLQANGSTTINSVQQKVTYFSQDGALYRILYSPNVSLSSDRMILENNLLI